MAASTLFRASAIATFTMALVACAPFKPKPTIAISRGPNPLHHHGEQAANDILFRAIGLVGTPYRHGGNTPDSGFDCSGLVDYVFLDVAGVVLPRTAQDIDHIQAAEIRRDDLASGDLIFFGRRGHITHVGIYVGEGRFVHAPNEGGTVRLDYLDGAYWRDHYAGAKRVAL
ncbi:MAG TPA: C40 family peptidase [Rudaea sp.]|jgi:cell wall-associated NlpC family hydrolase|nr:C40 family peptidase [Rudaea sp.]